MLHGCNKQKRTRKHVKSGGGERRSKIKGMKKSGTKSEIWRISGGRMRSFGSQQKAKELLGERDLEGGGREVEGRVTIMREPGISR